jgi:hypothetical protein
LNHREKKKDWNTAQQSCNQKNEISTADYTDVADKEILLAGNLLLMGNRIKDTRTQLI